MRDHAQRKLTILATVIVRRNGRNRKYVDCLCECGGYKRIRYDAVLSGETKSCGCLSRQASREQGKRNTKHGHSRRIGGKTRTYRIWAGMIQRTINPNRQNWERYGGRGIAVCARWRVFEHFLSDMGEVPAGMSIDRYPDNDGNYAPGNCRWATAAQQSSNRRVNRCYNNSKSKSTCN